jgi:hypothetical protein
MTALIDLVQQARAAGFRLAAGENKTLLVNGPRNREDLARELLARKSEILSTGAVHVYSGTVTVLDWRRAPISEDSRPCVICSRPTLLLDWDRRPCHKRCAETAIAPPSAGEGRAA